MSRPGFDVLMRRYERYGRLSSRVVVTRRLVRLVSLNTKYKGYSLLKAFLQTLKHFAPEYRVMARTVQEQRSEWNYGRERR